MAIVLYLIVGLLYVAMEMVCDIAKELSEDARYRHFYVSDYILGVFTWPFRAVRDICEAVQKRAESRRRWKQYCEAMNKQTKETER